MSKSSSNFPLEISSDGLGGLGPDGMMERFFKPVSFIISLDEAINSSIWKYLLSIFLYLLSFIIFKELYIPYLYHIEICPLYLPITIKPNFLLAATGE